MTAKIRDFQASAVRFGIFVAMFLAAFIGSWLLVKYVAWDWGPRIINLAVLFWPQLAIPLGFTPVDNPADTYLYGKASVILAIVFWVAVAAGFGWVTRRWKLRYVSLAVYPCMALVMLGVHMALYLFGVESIIDAP